MIIFPERPKDLDAQLRNHTTDSQNRSSRAGLQRIEEHGAIARHHGEVRGTKRDSLSEPGNVVRAVFDANDIWMFSETRHGFRFDLDPSQRRHAVKQQWDRRSISN